MELEVLENLQMEQHQVVTLLASPLGASALPVSAQGYPITVGAGGAGVQAPASSNLYSGATTGPGVNSVFSTITSQVVAVQRVLLHQGGIIGWRFWWWWWFSRSL